MSIIYYTCVIINIIKYHEHKLKLTNETNTSSQNKETVNCTHLYVFLRLFSVANYRRKFELYSFIPANSMIRVIITI
jgi:hypothetical protein